VIVATQSILRDERQLFATLPALEPSTKNLLTYYFDKHGVRGPVEGVGPTSPSGEKLEKEMERLDVRIGTPIKA
jgi:CLIP-associating protein 1/2